MEHRLEVGEGEVMQVCGPRVTLPRGTSSKCKGLQVEHAWRVGRTGKRLVWLEQRVQGEGNGRDEVRESGQRVQDPRGHHEAFDFE